MEYGIKVNEKMQLSSNISVKDRYIRYLKGREKAENTIKSYTTDINLLYGFMREYKQIDNEYELLKSITNDDIEDYMYDMQERYALSSINQHLASWKNFFDYVMKNKHIIDYNPVDGIESFGEKIVYTTAKKKDILTLDEIKEVIKCSYIRKKGERYADFTLSRNRFIFATLCTTGLRVEELLQAEKSWLEKIEEGYMLNIPASIVKNKIDKRVPITNKVLHYFKEYELDKRSYSDAVESNLIVCSPNGKKISTSNCNTIIKKLIEKANIDKHISPHCCRHTCTTILVKRHVSEILIDKILGWKTNSMRNRYSDHVTEYDKEKIEACNFL